MKYGELTKMNRLNLRKARLLPSGIHIDGSLESAIEESFVTITKSIASKKAENDSLHENFDDSFTDSATSGAQFMEPSDEQLKFWNQQGELYNDINFLEEQKRALLEMKIIYLYKNVEIHLKESLSTAFPDINTTSFYKWQNIKDFMNSYQMKFSTLTGYSTVNELRVVNNNVKHSSDISDTLAKMNLPEFKDSERLECDNLEIFYARIRPDVEPFLKEFRQELYNHIFEFDEARLTEIADDFSKRMDSATMLKLSLILRKKKTTGAIFSFD
jgi:hypothetical protein